VPRCCQQSGGDGVVAGEAGGRVGEESKLAAFRRAHAALAASRTVTLRARAVGRADAVPIASIRWCGR